MFHSAAAKSLQSCPILCDPIDGSLPGSPVPGLLQARTLEWVAISFSNILENSIQVHLQSRNRDTDIENKCMDTKGKGGGGRNWEIGIAIYTHY